MEERFSELTLRGAPGVHGKKTETETEPDLSTRYRHIAPHARLLVGIWVRICNI